MTPRRLVAFVAALSLAIGFVSCTREATPPKNKPPIASMEFTPTVGEAPLTVRFSAENSTDPDGQIVSYVWDFGDGARGTGMITEHEYTRAGSFVVTLTVTDDKGAKSSTNGTILVLEPSTPPPPSGRTDKIENDLIIYTRTVPDTLSPNQTFTITVVVTAKTALRALVVSETLPEGVQLVSGNLRAAQLGMSANQKLEFRYEIKVGSATGTFTISGRATPATEEGAQPALELKSSIKVQ
ncbi:MAG: PKD domain-containing protein [Candidatus Bipolaricaulota bacterium]|nr:PKD domain-containing protein [Candidatus Bipolaricaulota bacterium]MDW8030202.1 PKD domain-containing protein [Candidatus Bipolaricaulota bacterium]